MNLAVLGSRLEAVTAELTELAALAERLGQPENNLASPQAQEAARTIARHLEEIAGRLDGLHELRVRLFH